MLVQVLEPGIVRDVAIGVKCVIIALCLQFALVFGRDVGHALKRREPVQLLPAWLIFFAAFAVTESLYLMGDIYGFHRDLVLDVGYSVIMVSATGLIYILESGFPYKTRGVFWKTCLGITVLILVLPRDPSRWLLAGVAGPVFVAFMLVFVVHMWKSIPWKAARPVWAFFLGLGLALAGTVFSADFFINVHGESWYLVGNFLTVVGFGIMGINATLIRSFEELEWPHVLHEFLLMRKNGELLYATQFTPGTGKPDEPEPAPARGTHSGPLKAGGLSGVAAMLKEISETTSDLHTIQHEDAVVEFYYGVHVVGVLFTRTHLDLVHWKLRALVDKIEANFGGVIEAMETAGTLAPSVEVLVRQEFRDAFSTR